MSKYQPRLTETEENKVIEFFMQHPKMTVEEARNRLGANYTIFNISHVRRKQNKLQASKTFQEQGTQTTMVSLPPFASESIVTLFDFIDKLWPEKKNSTKQPQHEQNLYHEYNTTQQEDTNEEEVEENEKLSSVWIFAENRTEQVIIPANQSYVINSISLTDDNKTTNRHVVEMRLDSDLKQRIVIATLQTNVCSQITINHVIPAKTKPQCAFFILSGEGIGNVRVDGRYESNFKKAETAIKSQHNINIVDELVGTGQKATSNKRVCVTYEMRLNDECGTLVEINTDYFRFKLGAHEVIKAWELGVIGMKVGGVRTLQVGPDLGYGDKGTNKIPPNSNLWFRINLMELE